MFMDSEPFFAKCRHIFCFFLVLILAIGSYAQQGNSGLCTGSLGAPVVNITFGHGENPGKQLSEIVPGAVSTYSFVSVTGNPAAPVPFDGDYTITNNVPYNPSWFSGMRDHTGDENGYMAFYNSSEQPGQFYQQTINNLCGSTTYEFAAWIANALDLGRTPGMAPDITFVIEKLDGTVIASYNTGAITQEYSFIWKQYGLFFTMPANESSVVLKMSNNNPGGNNHVGNDLAIDDITFRPCGPSTTASLDKNEFKDFLQLCSSASKVSLYGAVSTGYTSPKFTWQQSLDNGATWTDIANSNSLTFAYDVPIVNSGQEIEVRLVSADGTAINSESCRVVSNVLTIVVTTNSTASISASPVCKGADGSLIFKTTSAGKFDITYSDGSQTFSQSGIKNDDSILLKAISKITTYSLLSLVGEDGCINKPLDPISVTTAIVNELPDANFQIQSICSGDRVKLVVDILAGAAPLSINYFDGVNTYSQSNLRNGDTILSKDNPLSDKYYTLLTIKDANGCISNTNSKSLVTVEKSQLAIPAEYYACKNTAVNLLATGAVSYKWSPASGLSDSSISNPTATVASNTIYTVTGISAKGCKTSLSTQINVYSDAKISVTHDTSVCINTSVTLNATGGNKYNWYASMALNDPSASQLTVLIDRPMSFYVDIQDANCLYKDSVHVTTISMPQFQQPASKEFCVGKSVQLDGANGPGFSYVWTPSEYLNNSTVPNPIASPASSIQYAVSITEPKCGFDTTFTVAVNVRTSPLLHLQKSNDIDCLNERAKLTATGGLTYLWSPKEYVDNPSIQTPEVRVDESTMFTLNASDKYGCTTTDSIYVKASKGGKGFFEVPNAFTPNGDGKNDCFGLKHWGNNTLKEFKIYNRWGETVFETKNLQNCWDGTYKGLLQPTDTYVYYITAKTFCGNIFKKGTIVLLR